MDFEFKSLGDEKDLKKLIDFLSGQSLGYPNYNDWIMKTESELLSEYKKPIIVYYEKRVVGNAIYQKHKELSRIREIKNSRMHPLIRNRYCAAFCFKQVEVEERKEFGAIICDLRSSEKGTLKFLLRMGYTPIGEKPLYDKNNLDTIMVKTFDKKTQAGIVYRAKELIF